MRIPEVLRRASAAGVTLRISGAEILIEGDVDDDLGHLRDSGFLWDWSGAAAADGRR